MLKAQPVDSEEVAKVTEEFKGRRKRVKIDIARCFDEYVLNCEDKIKLNTKCFFAFTKSLRKTNSLPNDMKLGNEVSGDRESICNLFAKFFSSVFNPPIENFQLHEPIYDPFQESFDEQTFPEFTFSSNQVQDAIKPGQYSRP